MKCACTISSISDIYFPFSGKWAADIPREVEKIMLTFTVKFLEDRD